jgi:hypothetical protein
MIKIISLIFMMFFLSACADESSSSSNLFSPPIAESTTSNEPTLVSINLYASSTSLQVGTDVDLYAYGVYSNGTQANITSTVSFTSSDELLLVLTGNNASAISAGFVQVTASYEDVSKSITLISFSSNLVGLELNYNSLTLTNNGVANLIVYGLYDNNQTQVHTTSATLSSQNTGVATIDSNGNIHATGAGSTTIDVSFNGFNTSLNLEVSSATIDSIQVTPALGSKPVGLNQEFIATANLSDGSTLDITNSVDWSSSDTSKLSINSQGVAQLLSAGSVEVSADLDGLSSTVSFTVLAKTLDSISLVIPNPSIAVDVLTDVTCLAHYSDGSSEDISSEVSLTLSDNSIALIDQTNTIRLRSLSVGVTDINASFSGLNASATLTVTAANLVSIEVQTNNSLLSAGVNAYFRAMGTYDDASVVDITNNVAWSISNASFGSISNSPSTKGLYNNTFNGVSTSNLTITATMGAITDDLEIILAPGVINSISITPSSATTNTLKNLDYKAYAHFADGASVEITDISTWTSSDTSIAIISNSITDAGRASTLNEGIANIQASYKGQSSNTSILTVDDGVAEVIPEEGDGLLASYFSGNNFDTLKGQRIDAQINFNWNTGQAPLGVGDNFSVRWTGQIKGKFTGDCQISSRSDDGFRMWIDGVSIIDVWFPHAPRWDHNYAVPFVEGEKQSITVEFFENGGHAVAELYWQCPGDATLDPIPMEYLFSE